MKYLHVKYISLNPIPEKQEMSEQPFPTRLRVLLAAFLLATAPLTQAGPPKTAPAAADAADHRVLATRIDAYMQAAVQHEQFAGSILVARDGVPLISKGYGMANYELAVPNTPDTVFHIASLTKQFTAMAVMQLQEQGKLKLGD